MAKYARWESNLPGLQVALKQGINDGLDAAGEETLREIDRGFARGTDAMGNQWEPLSEVTIRRKGHSKILIDEGEMRAAFDTDLDPQSHELAVYNSNWKAPIHEFGQPDRNIPARPMLRPALRHIETEEIESELLPAIRTNLTLAGRM